jgi:Helix-turn-helix
VFHRSSWQSLFGLILLGSIVSLVFYFCFAARYSLNQFGYRPWQTIGFMNRYSSAGALLYIAAFGVVFSTYWLGYRLLKQTGLSPDARLLAVVVGFGLLFNLILLPMYPADATDIYDNIMRGRMSAIYGLNPLQDTPNDIKLDTFYRFTAWRNVPSAYGPVWEMLARVTEQAVNTSNRTTNVIAFKLLSSAAYALSALFIALTLRRTAPRRVLIGLYLWLWNPLAVYMTAATGHNDAVMIACMLAAVYLVARRWYVAGTLAGVLGALVKFIPALLLPLIVVVAFRALGWRRWLRYLVVSVSLSALLFVGVYAPYWHGWETLRTERRESMYTGSVATVLRELLIPVFDQVAIETAPSKTPITNALLANSTLILFGLFYAAQLLVVWRDPTPSTLIRVAARLILFYLLVVSLWFQAWYALWVLALAALLEDTPMRRLVMMFSYLVTWQAFFYNYLVVKTKSGVWLPWLDLVPVGIYMGCAWLYTGWYQLTTGLQKWRQQPADQRIGQRLEQARLAAGLSPSELSDELAIPYDVLRQYERGERPLRLDHGRRLAQRLGLSLDEWLGMKA